MARWLHIGNIVETVQRLPAMARGVSDGFCQMVALPLTIWHGQCVIDTSGTPIFYAHFSDPCLVETRVRAAAELDANVQFVLDSAC